MEKNLLKEEIDRIKSIMGIYEQSSGNTKSIGSTLPTGEKFISGPHTSEHTGGNSYYVYQKGDKFFIYVTNTKQKTPILNHYANDGGDGHENKEIANLWIEKLLEPETDDEKGDNEWENPIKVPPNWYE